MKMSEFLLELYSEEIPSFLQNQYANILKADIEKLLDSESIEYSAIKSYSGPCRLAIYIENINYIIPSKETIIKGPKINAPDLAIKGFCDSNLIDKSDLFIQALGGIEYYFFKAISKVTHTKEILEQKIPDLLKKIVWPKSMYWGNHEINWIRPLKNILCLIDSETVIFHFGHLESNNLTFGHKFLRPKPKAIISYKEYIDFLHNNFVILDQNERKEIIISQLHKYAQHNNLKLVQDERLLEEVSGLIEWPEILIGSIDKEFLHIPNEILSTAIRVHQKYFSLQDQNGNLAPYFAFICNVPNNHKEIIRGNEKVLRARLNDAVFFYNQDSKYPLSTRLSMLKKLSFHKKSDSIYDKSVRLERICQFLSRDDHNLKLAAKLSKCDLVTEIVTEFPNLQGIMGYYYSLNEGLDEAVALGIRDHYMPINIEDKIPQTQRAQLLSLADKFDSLVVLHSVGEKATGSKDPMSLRRTAIAIIRVILEGNHTLYINQILKFITDLLPIKDEEKNDLINHILSFIEERLKYYLKNKYETKYLDSIIDLKSNSDITDLVKKLDIIMLFTLTEQGQKTMQIYNRVVNIIENQDNKEIDITLLEYDEEKALNDEVNIAHKKISSHIAKYDYLRALKEISSLEIVTNNFFDNVLVNTEEIEIANNRKALLCKLKSLFDLIGDFSFVKR